MNKPLARFAQTTSEVRDMASLQEERRQARLREHQTLCGMLLFSQLLVNLSLYMFTHTGPASWWVLLALLAPAGLLFAGTAALSRRFGSFLMEALRAAGGAPLSCAATVALTLSLLVDMQLAMLSFTQLTRGFVLGDTYRWTSALTAAGAALLSLLAGGKHGVTRFAFLMRWVLAAFLAIVLLSVARYGSAGNLHPMLGQGLDHCLQTGAFALGGVWIAALFFAPPSDAQGGAPAVRRGAFALCAGVALCALTALGYSFVQPFYAFTRQLSYAERLLVLVESHPSSLTWSLLLVGLLFLFLITLTGGAALAGGLLHGQFPRLPARAAAAALVALTVPLALPDTPDVQRLMIALAPWRFAAAAAVVLGGWLCALLRGKRGKAA